ncbi:sensor histidine kinase, partial [Nocardia wallacei]|uniref:sensor histidine kinase n=1 Tax=Nocardia wallacei TaxID=480035 RepID=UPI002458DEB7
MRFRRTRLLPTGSKKLTTAVRLVRPRTILGQLTRVLVASIALALVLLGVIVAREVGSYRDTDATARAVSLALSAQDLMHELQRERGLTNGLLGGDATLRPALDTQRAATDAARRALDAALLADAPGASRVRTALGQLSALGGTRDEVDNRRVDRPGAFQFYTGAIGTLGQARPGLDHARDERVWRGLQALYSLGEAKEFAAQERGFLNGVFTAGGFGPGEYSQFLTIRAARQAAVTAFEQNADPDQRAGFDAVARSDDAVRAAETEAVALAADHGPLPRPVAAADWWTRMTSVIDAQRGVQGTVGAAIERRADQLRTDAAIKLGVYTGAAVLALLALVVLVVASARAIVRPLAALSSEADDVATRRLPELIDAWHTTTGTEPDPPRPVRTPAGASTEIVSVAEAFDRVQATAYELASQQALLQRNTTESLANLGRRNQNLVRRQLALISEFEKEELDPKMLANMFELDHLATRMRRNAESLLVLVGEASPRRWAEPIPLTDVVRAALSEVDDYRRVALRRIDDVPITGAAVSELAHMLAELIENGLAFSPPDLEVEIYGRRLAQQYLLAVVDHGVGMSAEQLADANARLRGEADFLVAPTRFLGHYVVGRLARRLGIEVELMVSPVSGVVARLLLPGTLLADPHAPRPETTQEVEHAVRDSHESNGYEPDRQVPGDRAPARPAPGGANDPAARTSTVRTPTVDGATMPAAPATGANHSPVPAAHTTGANRTPGPTAHTTGANRTPGTAAHTTGAHSPGPAAHTTGADRTPGPAVDETGAGRGAGGRTTASDGPLPGSTGSVLPSVLPGNGENRRGGRQSDDHPGAGPGGERLGRHRLAADRAAQHSPGPQPDPFPTLPPGPMKDSLYAAQRSRAATGSPEGNIPADPGHTSPKTGSSQPDSRTGAPGSHSAGDTPVAEVQRTRNGLVKRARKTRDAGARPGSTPRPPGGGPPPPPPPPTRPPQRGGGPPAPPRPGRGGGAGRGGGGGGEKKRPPPRRPGGLWGG